MAIAYTFVIKDSQANEAEVRPNLLFIIFDDLGWRDTGAYGSTWVRTPHLDRVAKEGVLFRNAFTSNPKCSPCRASILTGRNTWQLKEAVSHGGYFQAGLKFTQIFWRRPDTVSVSPKGWGPGDLRLWQKRDRNPAGPSFNEHQWNHRIGYRQEQLLKKLRSILGAARSEEAV